MKIKTVIRIPKARLTIFPAIVLISFYAMTEKTSNLFAEYADYKKWMLVLAFLFVLPKLPDIINIVAKKRHFPVFLILAAFALMVLISSQQTRYIVPESRVFYRATFLIGFIAELYCVMIYVCERNMIGTVIRICNVLAWIVLIVSDVVFLLTSRLPMRIFLVGDKFMLVYQHIYAITFFYLSDRVNNRSRSKHLLFLLAYSAYTVFIAILASCMTGLLGYILFVILWVLVDHFKLNLVKILSNPMVMAVFFLANLLVTFSFELILQNPDVENFVVETLGRSSNMTGRLNIYRDFLPLTKEHLLWGYGTGNQYYISMQLFRYADTQNAILEWVIQFGIPATILLLMTFLHAFAKLYRSSTERIMAPLVILIYVFVFMGTVEITFCLNFILWTAIIYSYSQAEMAKSNMHRVSNYAKGTRPNPQKKF